MAESKYKPLSFSTTMRNPERIAAFLKCLLPYEDRILTNSIIDEIVRDVIREKLYTPMYVTRSSTLKRILEDTDACYSDTQLEEIISNSPQKHKEAGFDYGWPSRFDTWYKLAKEFGFVYYELNRRIIISRAGHMLIDALSGDVVDDQKIHDVFLNVMAKYQSKNPFRKTLNNNVPLILLLNVIDRLKRDNPNSPGVYRQELSFCICWPNSDSDALYDKIKNFRNRYGISGYTDEIIYNECLKLLGYDETGKKYIKLDKVTGEAIDEYIRKMRITGVVSLRGNGRFLDWNTLELAKIRYLLSNYNEYTLFSTREEYFSYMGEIDQNLFTKADAGNTKVNEIRQHALHKYASEFSNDFVFDELRIVCSKKESKDPLLKFIPAPARLEFLTSISLVQNCKNLQVAPNYPVDDEGIPTSTAAGGMGDIECKDDMYELVEVTLMCGRNQVSAEMLPITRHLKELSERTNEGAFAIFLAPTIHPDAARYSQWTAYNDKLNILTYNVTDFINVLKTYNTLSQLMYPVEVEYGLAQVAESTLEYKA